MAKRVHTLIDEHQGLFFAQSLHVDPCFQAERDRRADEFPLIHTLTGERREAAVLRELSHRSIPRAMKAASPNRGPSISKYPLYQWNSFEHAHLLRRKRAIFNNIGGAAQRAAERLAALARGPQHLA